MFCILWLFRGLGYSFWVATGVPVSFLGALFLLALFGVAINMISILGLLIGVGLLMDDVIVISGGLPRATAPAPPIWNSSPSPAATAR